MIIKRTSKLEKPIMKRCKNEPDVACEEEDYPYPMNPKKQKTNGYHSHCEVEDFSSGSGSLSSEVSYWSSESELNSKNLSNQRESIRRSDSTRPPLLKSSRGRLQMLPSRFKDSVLDAWKNRDLRIEDIGSSFDDDEFKERDEFCIETFDSHRGGYLEQKPRYSSSKSLTYCKKEEDREIDLDGFNDFDNSMYASSHNSVRSSVLMGKRECMPDINLTGLKKLTKERAGKRKDVYKPEDFALGDMVWAKCGKRYPAWPAVVIDPILQAPDSVLRSCIPGAICVMFFGYSKNGTQRVK